MKNKNVELVESGLKCDNQNCDWSDMTIKHTDYHKYINQPCPKCGENILTEEDYNTAILFHSVMNAVNNMSEEELNAINLDNLGDILVFSPEDNKKLKENPDKEFRIRVDLHKGIKFNIEESEE